MKFKTVGQIVLLTVFLNCPFLIAAPKFTGPTSVKPGTLTKLSIDGIDGLNDPKIECSPTSHNWTAVRDFFNKNPVILFMPTSDDTGKTFNFVVAGNKDSKTFLTIHVITVEGVVPPGPEPKPPGPEPGPEPKPPGGKYTEELKSAYLVNPDAQSLAKLIGVYEAMSNHSGMFTNYRIMWETLIKSTAEAVGPNKLTAVRDKVALILQRDLADRASDAYDPKLAAKVFKDLADSLKPLEK